MTKPDDGGPAFPVSIAETKDGEVYGWGITGMSLRDWFAGQVLQGLCAYLGRPVTDVDATRANLAEHAYALADAMLSARKEEDNG